MKSKRTDKRGHWPKGKPRNPLALALVRPFLRKLRRQYRAGHSYMELAARYGVPRDTVRNWITGRTAPSMAHEATVKRALGVQEAE